MSDFLWKQLDFLMDGSTFASAAVWMLAGSAALYVVTRYREFLILFFVTMLYLIPFLFS